MVRSHATIYDDRLHTMVHDLQVELVKLRVIDSRAHSTTPVSPVDAHIRIQKYKLPKLSIPEFDGNPLHWAQRFSSAVDSNDQLDEHDKLTYLQEAIKDKKASDLVWSTSSTPGQYSKLVTILKDRYDQQRLMHEPHMLVIVNHSPVKTSSYEEICDLHDTVKHLSGLHASGQYKAGAILTSIIASKLNNKSREQWLIYSRDKMVPEIVKFVEFLEKSIVMTPTANSTNHTKPIKQEYRCSKASVWQLQ